MPNPKAISPEEPSFSDALTALEDIVDRFKGEVLPLEEALTLFETGVARVRYCQATLRGAEGRVDELVKTLSEDGFHETVPFDDAQIL